MTGAAQDAEAPHALRLTALVAAARVAAMQGQAALAAEVAGVLSQAAQAAAGRRLVVRDFAELVQGQGRTGILPFTADALTTAFATLAYPQSSRDAQLRLYSTSSVTDLGFVLCTINGPVYVDRVQPKTDSKQPSPREPSPTPVVDLSDRGVPDDWLDALAASEAAPPQALLAPGAGDTLHFKLTPQEATRWLTRRGRVRLVLLKAGSAGRVARRDLGPVAVKGQGGNERTLVVDLSGAQQIELHAAFFDGWWMLLGEDELRALSPVPDLDSEAPPVQCRTDLPLWGWGSLPGSDTWLDVPAELAARLVARYWWMSPVDSSTWLTMLTTPEKGPDEALAIEERP
jgi:hypothetical protein